MLSLDSVGPVIKHFSISGVSRLFSLSSQKCVNIHSFLIFRFSHIAILGFILMFSHTPVSHLSVYPQLSYFLFTFQVSLSTFLFLFCPRIAYPIGSVHPLLEVSGSPAPFLGFLFVPFSIIPRSLVHFFQLTSRVELFPSCRFSIRTC